MPGTEKSNVRGECVECYEREFCDRIEDVRAGLPPRKRRAGSCGFKDKEE